jgi:hypothetical protein
MELFGQTDFRVPDTWSTLFAEAASTVGGPDGRHSAVRAAATKIENGARRFVMRRGKVSDGAGSFG